MIVEKHRREAPIVVCIAVCSYAPVYYIHEQYHILEQSVHQFQFRLILCVYTSDYHPKLGRA